MDHAPGTPAPPPGGQADVESTGVESVDRVLAVDRRGGVVPGPFDQAAEDVADVLVVVHHEESQVPRVAAHEARLDNKGGNSLGVSDFPLNPGGVWSGDARVAGRAGPGSPRPAGRRLGRGRLLALCWAALDRVRPGRAGPHRLAAQDPALSRR